MPKPSKFSRLVNSANSADPAKSAQNEEQEKLKIMIYFEKQVGIDLKVYAVQAGQSYSSIASIAVAEYLEVRKVKA